MPPSITSLSVKDKSSLKIREDNEGGKDKLSHEFSQLLRSFPRERGWRTSYLYKYQNFWCQAKEIQAIMTIQRHMQARDTDVFLASIPKSGTTWLKALVFALMNRIHFSGASEKHPLLTSNPHELVAFLEYKLYANNQIPDLSGLEAPRTFATHIPYPSLPDSVKYSGCKVVYICRNPLDTFISSWHFIKSVRSETLGPLSMEQALDMFCKGIVGFGPFWDHMLGYWNESLLTPNKVLFLKYEDMMEDITYHMKKLANFLGCPFSLEEEKDGIVEEISRLCSFDNLKDLKANKSGQSIAGFENKSLFRKGVVGDWVNHLSPPMVEQLSRVMEEKLGGSGLSFKVRL